MVVIISYDDNILAFGIYLKVLDQITRVAS